MKDEDKEKRIKELEDRIHQNELRNDQILRVLSGLQEKMMNLETHVLNQTVSEKDKKSGKLQ